MTESYPYSVSDSMTASKGATVVKSNGADIQPIGNNGLGLSVRCATLTREEPVGSIQQVTVNIAGTYHIGTIPYFFFQNTYRDFYGVPQDIPNPSPMQEGDAVVIFIPTLQPYFVESGQTIKNNMFVVYKNDGNTGVSAGHVIQQITFNDTKYCIGVRPPNTSNDQFINTLPGQFEIIRGISNITFKYTSLYVENTELQKIANANKLQYNGVNEVDLLPRMNSQLLLNMFDGKNGRPLYPGSIAPDDHDDKIVVITKQCEALKKMILELCRRTYFLNPTATQSNAQTFYNRYVSS